MAALYQKAQTSEQELIKAVSAVLDSRQSDTQRPNKRNLSEDNPMNVDNVDKRRQQSGELNIEEMNVTSGAMQRDDPPVSVSLILFI